MGDDVDYTQEPRQARLIAAVQTPSDPAVGYGFRTATYGDRQVPEISYFALAHHFLRYASHYAQAGDVLDVGAW